MLETPPGSEERPSAAGLVSGAAVLRLRPDEVESFAREQIFGPGRTRPIVAVTTSIRTGRPWLDPAGLALLLEARAQVVLLETGEATWALSRAVPPRLDVYGGALRVWHPGVAPDSDPYDHPLIFLYGPADIEAARRQVLEEVFGDEPTVPPSPTSHASPTSAARSPQARPPARPAASEVQEAVVASLRGGRVRLDVAGVHGVLMVAGISREVLARELVVGQKLRVRAMGPGGRGEMNFSAKGLVRMPWERLGDEIQAGDVLRGLVVKVEERFALVELLPGAAGHVPLQEVDWDPVRKATEVLREGEVVTVEVLSLDVAARRAGLSIKRAFGKKPRPRLTLVPGGRPFPREAGEEAAAPAPGAGPGDGNGGGNGSGTGTAGSHMAQELRAALEDRGSLLERVKKLGADLAEERKARRAAEDREEFLRRRYAGDADPVSSERAFLQAVRVAHARMFEEGDRATHPLRRMRVGREFLARLRSLDGIPVVKVIEVCAQVASGKAQEIPGREVHALSPGKSAAGFRVRSSDGAKAWRCSLQDGTPGARRLHWWSVPGPDGGTVEFAGVGVHDDLTIPE